MISSPSSLQRASHSCTGCSTAVILQTNGQGVKVERGSSPLLVSAEKKELWSEHGKKLFQLDCFMLNEGEQIRDVRIAIRPAGCRAHWNLTPIVPGELYGLLGFWAEAGGLAKGESMGWGGIFEEGKGPTLTVKPA